MIFILLLFLLINILAFIIFSLDKHYAIKNQQRFSEKSLHALSILGGFVGAFCAMFIFHHKIKKFQFLLIQLFILIGWIILAYIIIYFPKAFLINL